MYKATSLAILCALILALLILAKSVLLPIAISLLITFLLLPVSNRLEKWHINKALAIVTSIILAIAVFVVFIYIVYLQLLDFASDIPANWARLSEKINTIHEFIVEHFRISKSDQVTWIGSKANKYADALGSFLLSVFSATGELLSTMILIPIYVFFITFYKDKIKAFVRMFFAGQEPEAKIELIAKVIKVSQRYLKGILLDVFILSIMNSAGFLMLGLDHAILFGILAAVLNIIPYVGVLIGSILPITMALITKDQWSYAFGAAAVCTVVQFFDNNFITPYVIGNSVSVNSLAAIVALIVCAMVWGIPGMILALPLTGMLKVVCDHIPKLKPYGYLIGDEATPRS